VSQAERVFWVIVALSVVFALLSRANLLYVPVMPRRLYLVEYVLRGIKYVLTGMHAIAIGVLAAATAAVLIALPAAIATLVSVVALAYAVTEVSDWIGARSNARRAAQRAAGDDETRPGTATL
jgi:hypothetical protein